tara:strand:- start:4176 stop:7436 length:3261 start_codon:yes stop_codon:yes gene_type:complete
MDGIEKARETAARFTASTIDRAKRRAAEFLRTSPPSPVRSGRIGPSWSLEDYATQVDDSRLFRDPARRDFDDLPTERLLVRTSGEPISLRSRTTPQDRYLTIVAETADLPTKQGLSGTVTAGGLPQVENKQQLKPLLARGLAYDQGEFERMARSNPVARNAVRATVERIAQASEFYATPDVDFEALVATNGVSPELRAKVAAQMREATDRAAEVLNLEWFHNPDIDPQQIIREQSYSMVPGFVLHEFGIDPRLQGRRRTTFVEHRAQSSVLRWLWDQRERWCGVVQNASGSPGLLADIPVSGVQVQGMPVIDSRKLLLVTNQRIGLNLEGVSDLRAAWYASQGKTEWFVSALMHRRKWGNGFPLFRMDADSAKAKGVSDSIASAAKEFFYSGQAYLSLPPGVTMEMMQFDSDTGFIAAMEYFDKELLRSLGSLATEIGQNGGSYSLADVQQAERLRQLQGYAQQIRSSRKAWIEAACATLIGDLAVLPELRIDGIMTRSDSEVLTVWSGVAQVRSTLKPDGTPMYSESDIRTLCDTVGVPFTSDAEAKEAQESSSEEVKAAPLLVGALQVAQQVLSALTASPINPTPIAPEAAVLLLSSAGVPEDVARKMVEAQIGRPVVNREAEASSAPVSQDLVDALTESADEPVEGQELPSDGGLVGGGAVDALIARKTRAKTLDEIDTKPTTGMAKIAKRALEWRAEFGRGGTEVGVARARDLASRKNLSEETVRRMRNYFTRHAGDSKAEGFDVGEDGFPSAGRVAWDLWGGDPGADWAERKVAEFDKVREKSKRRVASSSLAARKPSVEVFGRDGRLFETHRPLVGPEKFVSWASLYSATSREAEALASFAAKLAESARSEFIRAVRPLVEAGDVKAIAALQFSKVEEFEKVFENFLLNWSETNRRDLLDEIKAQVGAGWKPSAEAATFPAELAQVVEAQAAALARTLDSSWVKRLKDEALTQAAGVRSVAALAEVEPPLATWQKQSMQTSTNVANLTREEVARTEGPTIKSARYSAIMDRLTCSNCGLLDGKDFVFGSAEYLKNRPPLYNCLSRLGPYGNVCRCIYIYTFAGASQEFAGPELSVEVDEF